MANTLLKKPVKIALVQLASGMSLQRYGIYTTRVQDRLMN
jgi:hypothetical protein